MTTYVLRRAGQSLLVVMVVCLTVFLIRYAMPGDPAVLMLPESATEAQIDAMRQALGLNEPVWYQLRVYALGLVQGELGDSLRYRKPVIDLLLERFPITFYLAVSSLLLALSVGIPLGFIGAIWRGGVVEHVVNAIALFGQALPPFWLGIMLVLMFSVNLNWFPAFGVQDWRSFALPSVALAFHLIGLVTRLVRTGLQEEFQEQYFMVARSKGLAPRTLVIKHAFRNALLPLVTVVGLQFGQLLGGAVVIETVFALPGLGRLVLDAISARDYPVVQGLVLVFAIVFLFLQLVVDVLYCYINPRIRLS